NLMDLIFSAGLSSSLIEVMKNLIEDVPSLQPTVQRRILKLVTVVLTKPQTESEDPQTIILALTSLAIFDDHSRIIVSILNDYVVKYLDNENPLVRKETAITCLKVLAHRASASTQSKIGQIICDILQRILTEAVIESGIQI